MSFYPQHYKLTNNVQILPDYYTNIDTFETCCYINRLLTYLFCFLKVNAAQKSSRDEFACFVLYCQNELHKNLINAVIIYIRTLLCCSFKERGARYTLLMLSKVRFFANSNSLFFLSQSLT